MDLTREFGLAPNIIEKDLMLGWLLAGISHMLNSVRDGHSGLALIPDGCALDVIDHNTYKNNVFCHELSKRPLLKLTIKLTIT